MEPPRVRQFCGAHLGKRGLPPACQQSESRSVDDHKRARFALHDVVQRTLGPILFPVPWARMQEIRHLQSMEAMRETILDAGFVLVAWNDVTEGASRCSISSSELQRHGNKTRASSGVGLSAALPVF